MRKVRRRAKNLIVSIPCKVVISIRRKFGEVFIRFRVTDVAQLPSLDPYSICVPFSILKVYQSTCTLLEAIDIMFFILIQIEIRQATVAVEMTKKILTNVWDFIISKQKRWLKEKNLCCLLFTFIYILFAKMSHFLVLVLICFLSGGFYLLMYGNFKEEVNTVFIHFSFVFCFAL